MLLARQEIKFNLDVIYFLSTQIKYLHRSQETFLVNFVLALAIFSFAIFINSCKKDVTNKQNVLNSFHTPGSDANAENALAVRYVNALINNLTLVYPSLTSEQAGPLAWGGLENTPAFASQIGIGSAKAQRYASINTAFRNGTQGAKSPCGNSGGSQ